MTFEQEASVLANLDTILSAPTPPPLPLPRRRWKRKLMAITALAAIGFGYYVYSGVTHVDTMAEKGLRLWDRTELLIQADPYHRSPASCDLARDAATKLRALQAGDKLDMLSERIVALNDLGTNAKLCVRELSR
jgi:hypothetical protein